MSPDSVFVYWDASAVLSALVQDEHSGQAHKWSKRKGIHFISTLCCAEVYAVLFRVDREKKMVDEVMRGCLEGFEGGPWRRLNLAPEWEEMKSLASEWTLRGADLWHLAAAIKLQREVPELILLTFDKRLRVASEGRGMAA